MSYLIDTQIGFEERHYVMERQDIARIPDRPGIADRQDVPDGGQSCEICERE